MNFEELQVRRLQSGDARILFQLVQRNQERLVKYFPVTLKAARSMMSTRSYVRENLRKMKRDYKIPADSNEYESVENALNDYDNTILDIKILCDIVFPSIMSSSAAAEAAALSSSTS